MRQTPDNDAIYKRLYSFPEMVADLLASLLPADSLALLDLGSLERLPTERVGDDYRRRLGDATWRVRRRSPDGVGRGGWLHVLVLLEFQSRNDRAMALRVLEYAALLYLELARQGALSARGRLPPVLPVVLYNGEEPWTAEREVADLIDGSDSALSPYQPSQRYEVLDEQRAAAEDLGRLTRSVVLAEQSRSPEDLSRLARRLPEWLRASASEELRRAFADWLWVLCKRLEKRGGELPAPPEELTLEDMTMTLEERVSRWPEPYIRQGIEEGLERGRREGRKRGRREGMERGKREGMERGRREGLEQGLDEQRALLRRLAAARFGERAADRLFARLRQERSQERLGEMGEIVVRCETAEELLRRLGA